MTELRLFLLGTPRLEMNKAPFAIRRRKALALLIYLAVTQQQQSRDDLATLFWAESTQRSARKALTRRISELRQLLGDGYLNSDWNHIQLSPTANIWLDVQTFHDQLKSCRTHGHSTIEVCPQCLKPLTMAFELYQDDFTSGFSLADCPGFEEWQLFEAEGLRQAFSSVLERLIILHQSRGEPEVAIPYARRWLALDPLHELAHQTLMYLYASSGQLAAALRQYQVCTEMLEKEFGLRPTEETNILHTNISTITKGQHLPSNLFPRLRACLQDKHLGNMMPLRSNPRGTKLQNNLPIQTTPFLGRMDELNELERLLADPIARLITILGVGGIGKTRLALEVATQQLSRFEHGVYVVRLGSTKTTDSIVSAIAEALQFSFYDKVSPIDQLRDYLREKSILLVLDNFEHLLECSEAIIDLLHMVPGLKLLVTSRASLNVREEFLFPIVGIDFPETKAKEQIRQSSAVQLFLDTVRRVQSNFTLSDKNAQYVAQICQLVQGMPLAIILAASWVKILTPKEIAKELGYSLNILETELRDLPIRQQSMRAVFDHTWALLSEPERHAFKKLTIFQGGFSRQAAETITGISPRSLMKLVNKSLLQRNLKGRYEIHSLLQQYGTEKLAEDRQQRIAICDQHCDFYCSMIGQYEIELKGAKQQKTLANIEADKENIHLAWLWAIDQDNLEAIDMALDGLFQFCNIRSRFQEGHDDFSRAVAHIQTSSAELNEIAEKVLTKLLARQALFDLMLGQPETANHLALQSLQMSQRLDMKRAQAFCLNVLGDINEFQGSYLEAGHFYQESMSISQEIDDSFLKAASFKKTGWIKHLQGDHSQSYRYFIDSLALYREIDHHFEIADLLNFVALAASNMGQLTEAEAAWTESLAIFRELDSSYGIAKALGGLGGIAWAIGGNRLMEGKQLHQERVAITRELGHRMELAVSLWGLADIHNDLKEYDQAYESANEGLRIAKEIGHTWTMTRCLIALSETAIGLEDFQTAWKRCFEALEIAAETQELPAILQVLINLILLLTKQESWFDVQAVSPPETILINSENERAIEILTLVINHPATWQIYKDKAIRLRTELAAALPHEAVKTAQEMGEKLDLMDTVRELMEVYTLNAPQSNVSPDMP